jgi:hypothetical protein
VNFFLLKIVENNLKNVPIVPSKMAQKFKKIQNWTAFVEIFQSVVLLLLTFTCWCPDVSKETSVIRTLMNHSGEIPGHNFCLNMSNNGPCHVSGIFFTLKGE